MNISKKDLIIILSVFAVVFISVFFVAILLVKDNKKPSLRMVSTKGVHYETLKDWVGQDGGSNKVILISRDLLKIDDMKELGEIINSEMTNYDIATVDVFTDRKSASLLMDFSLIDQLSGDDIDSYSKNYAGKYIKNQENKYGAFTIFFDGPNGNDQTTIKY